MATLQVKHLPDELYETLKQRAAAQDTTVSGYVLALLRRDLERMTLEEWFDMVEANPPFANVSQTGAEIIREVREAAEREWDDHFDDRR